MSPSLRSLSRRTLLKLAGAMPAGQLIGLSVVQAEEMTFSHAVTLYDDIKYPPDFKHFDYVNPDAPKGGKVRLYGLGSFDSLNAYTYKGNPTPIGAGASETLVSRALDEPTTDYGLLASGIWHPEDRSRVVFKLRPEAKFHDGTAITVEDVIWSFTAQKEADPDKSQYWRNVSKLEQTGENEVTFFFDQKNNRELPSTAAQVAVLSKAWWAAKSVDGKDRNINELSLEPILGSGPYRIGTVKPGQSISLLRVPDYWGKNLPVNIGQNNFDEIEYNYYADPVIALEAFKGDQYDYRSENISKQWATGYDFPAVKEGRVIKEELSFDKVKQIQAWVLNLRRPKFQDVRVRRAFNLAFDFEWANQNLFYGVYKRCRSIFNDSEYEATGLPSPEELALLEPLKANLPPEVFTTEYTNPVNDTPQARRKNLREAAKLFADAGWNVSQDGGKNLLKNAKGEIFTAEILIDQPTLERIAIPYQQQLELLGVKVELRRVDDAQNQRLESDFDYDIIVKNRAQSMSPGNEQRFMWGSAAADAKGSQNYSGIKDKAVDALIEKLIFVNSRKDLVTACKALDRVMMANNFFVPMYFSPFDRVARWDRFSHAATLPKFASGFPTIWWWDEEKAKKAKG